MEPKHNPDFTKDPTDYHSFDDEHHFIAGILRRAQGNIAASVKLEGQRQESHSGSTLQENSIAEQTVSARAVPRAPTPFPLFPPSTSRAPVPLEPYLHPRFRYWPGYPLTIDEYGNYHRVAQPESLGAIPKQAAVPKPGRLPSPGKSTGRVRRYKKRSKKRQPSLTDSEEMELNTMMKNLDVSESTSEKKLHGVKKPLLKRGKTKVTKEDKEKIVKSLEEEMAKMEL